MSSIPQKRCTKCGAEKPLDQFHRNKSAKDGLTSNCAECNKLRAREWGAQNKERARVTARKNYLGKQDAYKKRAKGWAKSNPERRREIWIKSASSHKEQKAAYTRQFRRDNPETVTAANHRRRDRKQNKHFTAMEWRELRQKFGNKCLCCGSTKRITADHVVPLSVGGRNTIDNIQPLCMTCNRRKWATSIDYRPSHLQDTQSNMGIPVQEQFPLDLE